MEAVEHDQGPRGLIDVHPAQHGLQRATVERQTFEGGDTAAR